MILGMKVEVRVEVGLGLGLGLGLIMEVGLVFWRRCSSMRQGGLRWNRGSLCCWEKRK
jgi:hypothetical protein